MCSTTNTMFQLRDYQIEIAKNGVDILRQYHVLYLAVEVRCGKTLMAIHAAEEGGYKRVLFFTKKKAINSIQSDADKYAPSFNLIVTNFEQAAKYKHHKPDLVIVDEAHSLGAFPKPSKRTLDIRAVANGCDVMMLSGTPSPESYSQLYHQFAITPYSPFKHTNFYKWAAEFVNVKKKRIGAGMLVNDYSEANGDLIWKHIKHLFIRYTQEQAGFVAPVQEYVLEVDMMDISRKMYRELEKEKIYTIPGIDHADMVATANGGGDLINKLAQISSGTLLFDGVPTGVIIDWSKAQFIRSYFYGQKIAIFYRYKAELELLCKFFPQWTASPEEFNSRNDLVFLGQVQSAREGVNLSTADALVMYNIDFSATSYFQARARIQSKDRKGSAPLYWIFSKHGIERKIYQAVSNKTNFTYSYYQKHARKTNTGKDQKGTYQTRLDSAATHINI